MPRINARGTLRGVASCRAAATPTTSPKHRIWTTTAAAQGVPGEGNKARQDVGAVAATFGKAATRPTRNRNEAAMVPVHA